MSHSASSSKQKEFYPSQLTPWLVRWVQFLSPFICRWLNKLDVVIVPSYEQELAALKNKRILFLANHPTFQDPIVMFLLSAQLGEMFYYLADHLALRGYLGPFLQRLGVYSIKRGLPDRNSVRHTLEILSQPNSRLVIFPEGGCSFQNDRVSPFRTGAIQLAFQALNRDQKQKGEIPDLYAIPISIKYRYPRDVTPIIRQLLQRLEKELNITAQGDQYQRLRLVGEKVLQRCEQDYAFASLEGANMNERIPYLKARILETIEQFFDVKTSEEIPDRERVYKLQYLLEGATNDENKMEGPAISFPAPSATRESLSEPSWQDQFGQVWSTNFIRHSLWRVLNFDAIYDGYVAENPSPERYLDTLTRLEREVFGIDRPPPKDYRQALVYIGKPMNLKDSFPAFQGDGLAGFQKEHRAATITQIVDALQSRVQHNLDTLAQYKLESLN